MFLPLKPERVKDGPVIHSLQYGNRIPVHVETDKGPNTFSRVMVGSSVRPPHNPFDVIFSVVVFVCRAEDSQADIDTRLWSFHTRAMA